MGICMNVMCRVEGRCDYCDARCPHFAESEALLRAIEGLPYDLSDKIKDLAHDITMKEIEEGRYL